MLLRKDARLVTETSGNTSSKPTTYHHNTDGTLDEIFTEATYVHIEQMDDNHWWMGITLPDGGTLHVNFWTPRARIRATYSEDSGPEGGEFGSGIKVPDHERVRTRFQGL